MILTPRAYDSLEDIIEGHAEEARVLLKNALEPLNAYTGKIASIIEWILFRGYTLSGGLYTDEIAQWAKALGVRERDILTANVSYELAQAGRLLAARFPAVGCTSTVMDSPEHGLVHVRNMDWDLKGMGRTSIVRLLKGKDREVVSVTNPGFVGILSGMVPGNFSITINWVPSTRRPRFDFGPVFLVRWVLENAKNFDAAVAYLSGTPLSSSVLFTVCGVNHACVIERTCKDSDIRWYDDEPLVVCNHYITEAFDNLNVEDESTEYSRERYQKALRAARRFKGKTLERMFKVLSGEDCLNELTAQQMVFAPAAADYRVRAYDI